MRVVRAMLDSAVCTLYAEVEVWCAPAFKVSAGH